MKAIVYAKYGSPDVLEFKDVEKPTPLDDEVLVEVHAASVNAYDWHFLTADVFLIRLMGGGLLRPKKKTLGAEIAGKVVAVGKNVTRFHLGDQVFGAAKGGSGGFAEHVCAGEKSLELKPPNVSFEEASTASMAALTALQGLRDEGQIQSGNKVLIYQFLKPASLDIGERFALQLGAVRIRVETLDIPWDMSQSFDNEKRVAQTQAAISEVLERIAQTGEKRFYDLLILDEIVFCLSKNLAKLEDIKNVIDRRDPAVEIVLTGRGATEELIAMADLVTEMKNIKHPFDKGLTARRGIEF